MKYLEKDDQDVVRGRRGGRKISLHQTLHKKHMVLRRQVVLMHRLVTNAALEAVLDEPQCVKLRSRSMWLEDMHMLIGGIIIFVVKPELGNRLRCFAKWMSNMFSMTLIMVCEEGKDLTNRSGDALADSLN
jgi:hypothetical protein